MKYAFVNQQRHHHRVKMLCHVLKVSRSGYYAWRSRPESERARTDRVLSVQIKALHAQSRERLGSVKAWRTLNDQGVHCGKHRVARLRRAHNIWARRRRRFVVTTQSKHSHWRAPNVLQRNFTVSSPDRAWVGDVTFVPTRQGWLYLAVLIDLYSRLVVGWAMSPRNDAKLVSAALKMAVYRRCPKPGLILHSDQGQTYAAKEYRKIITANKMRQSMSRKGDCWDNAVAESFFASVEFEVIEQQTFATRQKAQSELFHYIEVFYNRQRVHQTLDYKIPADVDQAYWAAA